MMKVTIFSLIKIEIKNSQIVEEIKKQTKQIKY